MRIAVVHPKATCISARKLAKLWGADIFALHKTHQRDFQGYDLVWNYGGSENISGENIANKPLGVARCIDKVQTFEVLKRNRIPTVEWAIKKEDVPKTWKSIVIRDSRTGRKAEGLYFAEQGEPLRDGELYTEYFPHEYEYRIVVMCGEVVGRYRKDVEGADWLFTPMLKQGFHNVDRMCIAAAEVIGIDYVGFDVLENKYGKCVIIEGNSGAMLQDEAEEFAKVNLEYIVDYVKIKGV